jgi:hypothetical protein
LWDRLSRLPVDLELANNAALALLQEDRLDVVPLQIASRLVVLADKGDAARHAQQREARTVDFNDVSARTGACRSRISRGTDREPDSNECDTR